MHFANFKTKFNKKYASPDEDALRQSIFCNNMKEVDERNAINGKPVFGVTKFSDQTKEEFSVLLGRKNHAHEPAHTHVKKPTGARAVTDVDWRTAGVVTTVKNQV